jgi:hypothetical protein
MSISRSCSWCHTMNPAAERYCVECGHEAHVCRLDCNCSRCLCGRAGNHAPAALADLIAAHRAALMAGVAPPRPRSKESSSASVGVGTANHEAEVRVVKRTHVRAELAERIAALMELLVSEFGFDLSISIWVRDGLIAASNPNDGYVPPLVAAATPTTAD